MIHATSIQSFFSRQNCIFSEKLYTLNFSFLTGAAKPKLIRQTAILADGDSTSSGKSVTFKVSEEDIAITSTECLKKNL